MTERDTINVCTRPHIRQQDDVACRPCSSSHSIQNGIYSPRGLSQLLGRRSRLPALDLWPEAGMTREGVVPRCWEQPDAALG